MTVSFINQPEVADGKIRDARDQGLFDDLADKERPLNLSPSFLVNPKYATAYRILKTSGFAPEWIELDKAIRKDLKERRLLLASQLLAAGRTSADFATDLHARHDLEAAFQPTASRYRECAQTINKKIELFNLMVPVVLLQKHKIRISADLVRFRESWLLALSALSQSCKPCP